MTKEESKLFIDIASQFELINKGLTAQFDEIKKLQTRIDLMEKWCIEQHQRLENLAITAYNA